MSYLIQHAPAIALCIAVLASVAAIAWLYSPVDSPTGEAREDTRRTGSGNRDHERRRS